MEKMEKVFCVPRPQEPDGDPIRQLAARWISLHVETLPGPGEKLRLIFKTSGLTHGNEVYKEVIRWLTGAGWTVETPVCTGGYALVIKHPWTPKGGE